MAIGLANRRTRRLAVTRQRCWGHDWVLEFDIRGLFDNIDHRLLMKAVRHHTNCKWVLLIRGSLADRAVAEGWDAISA